MRIRFRRRTAAASIPNPRPGEADDGGPVVAADGTGWVTVLASPSWWRTLPTMPDLPGLVEQWAAAGGTAINTDLCRTIGPGGGAPCVIDTAGGRCPLHDDGVDDRLDDEVAYEGLDVPRDDPRDDPARDLTGDDLCGQLTKAGRPCRWNTVTRGPCLPHRRVPAEI